MFRIDASSSMIRTLRRAGLALNGASPRAASASAAALQTVLAVVSTTLRLLSLDGHKPHVKPTLFELKRITIVGIRCPVRSPWRAALGVVHVPRRPQSGSAMLAGTSGLWNSA